MKCTSCNRPFNEKLSPICPYCGMDHHALLKQDTHRREKPRGGMKAEPAAPADADLSRGERLMEELSDRGLPGMKPPTSRSPRRPMGPRQPDAPLSRGERLMQDLADRGLPGVPLPRTSGAKPQPPERPARETPPPREAAPPAAEPKARATSEAPPPPRPRPIVRPQPRPQPSRPTPPPPEEAPVLGSARRPAESRPVRLSRQEQVQDFLTQANLAHQRGQSQRAEKLACKGLVLDPDNVQLLTLLGQLLYQQGQIEGALQEWRSAQRLDPDNPQRQVWIERAEAELGGAPPAKPEPAVAVHIESIAGQAVPEDKTPEEIEAEQRVNRMSSMTAALLLGVVVAGCAGWVTGLVEGVFYRFHLLIPLILGFVIGRYLSPLSARNQRAWLAPSQRAWCAVLLVLAAYAVSLYVPYRMAKSHTDGGDTQPGFLQRLEQQRLLTMEHQGLPEAEEEPAEAPPQEDSLTASTGSTLVTSSFPAYLLSRASHPLDFYRVKLPGPAFWLLLALEAVLACLAALQFSGVFE